ncbi:UvrABC system protein A [Roseimaritima multifibrata]|uniref:UvrABC system protein A n=1 Tax=Roseimaritima multifibrata TaxID=1930274 RepID=A0A517MCU1_9BACT|nr:excinuclease ABC subunit UvrA [Roseimaritima multifibrata]QDS92701.1 UvrABC system protein A [Roseimaritima multifibrata]
MKRTPDRTIPRQNKNLHPTGAEGVIRIRGARAHNLQGIDLDLPRDRLTVITGVSGSGKSSLAFDTLYAEGQRQYIESLSSYARQFLDQLQRPDVDWMDGLEPTLCIDQKPGTTNPRSTVATVTEIYDYLRLLYARIGTPHCYNCGTTILQQSPENIVDSLLTMPEQSKLMLLAPLVRGRKGKHADVFEEIGKAGFVRARVDGELYPLDALPDLAPRRNHTIEAVVDRMVIRDEIQSRLEESIRHTLKLGNGLLIAVSQLPGKTEWEERLISTAYACPECGVSYAELEPRTFSFNSPYGACEQCHGMGVLEGFEPDSLVDWEQSADEGGLLAYKGATAAVKRKMREAVEPFLVANRGSWQQPLGTLRPPKRERLLHGDESTGFPGLLALLEQEWETTRSEKRADQLRPLRGSVLCSGCQGGRLRPESLSVTVADQNIHQLTSQPISKIQDWFSTWMPDLNSADAKIAKPISDEVSKRLQFLNLVGVGYLSLNRPADTLSGGELQRVRLATSIGSGLVGVCYVLDEPSIGLHQRDNDRLIGALRDLQQQGNTVLVVEHDEAMMWAADWLIDMGPGAGKNGGHIISQGTPAEVAKDPQSVTGPYLSGQTPKSPEFEARVFDPNQAIVLHDAETNNLKKVTARFPLGTLIGVTGVSGSGKSSLINDTLSPAISEQLGLVTPRSGPYKKLTGAKSIDKLIRMDQAPIGRSPRSCPATYTKALDEIRKVYAATREAKTRGFNSSRFSFNASAGQCPQCKGYGQEKIEMNFLSDLYVTCSACNGRRYNQATLQVRFKGQTIADILEMTIDQAAEFFTNIPKVDRILQSLRDVGLGYLRLGQPSTTLSGGEAQRIKLGTELARSSSGSTLYILDEPTTGLHFEDVLRLMTVLRRLAEAGNTVIVIEHNLDVARACDWLIDLGPDGGEAGGFLIAEGPPDTIRNAADSETGKYL